MSDAFFVLFGALVGAPLRFFIGRVLAQRWKRAFPMATFLINVTGSLALGLLLGHVHTQWIQAFIGTGMLGAYTTFSTFGVEAVTLLEQKKTATAVSYVISSALVGILAAWIGYTW